MNNFKLNGNTNPTWGEVETAFQALALQGEDQGFSLEFNSESWIIIDAVPEYGYLVTVSAVDSYDYYALVDNSLSHDCVLVWCAGEYMHRILAVFVSQEQAARALNYYFAQGRCDPGLSWKREDDTWCPDSD